MLTTAPFTLTTAPFALTTAPVALTTAPPFAGTARTLVQLAQTQPQLLRPHAARLLRTLHAASLSERSEIARGAYAAAASHVARGAPVEVLGKLVQDLTARYAEWL